MNLAGLVLAAGLILAAPLAIASPPPDAVDVEACADETPLPPLVIGFPPRDPEGLETLLREQLDPGSPRYHAWLTPAEYGARFGVPPADYAAAVGWLQKWGFTDVRTWPGASAIAFRGDAGKVHAAFGARLHRFAWHGEQRIAPLDAPRLPTFGATRASGLVGLDGFARVHRKLHVAGAGNRLAPADVQRVFGLDTLHAGGKTGAGATIGILAVADFSTSDVDLFRSRFGLPPANLQKIDSPGAPASSDPGDVLEALIDTQWSGVVAPEATIVAQIGGDTAASALLQAELDVINANHADVISISFGACEFFVGSAGLRQIDTLARQAAAQGQTVVVASGDDGSADCIANDPARTAQGVNGLASTPFVTAVGGTTLDPAFDANGDATGYGGEVVWNESNVGLGASGGGRSNFFTKPVWQFGPGVPSDGVRDLPDVAFAAAVRSPGYLVVAQGASCVLANDFCAVGGTSVGTPIWAGLVALLVSARGGRLGVVNPELYRLGRLQAAGGAAAFHDVTVGSNALSTTAGFAATAGFDLATGWGSFDAPGLVAGYGACSTDGECGDGVECTQDRCTPAGCSNPAVPDATPCDTGDPCAVHACRSGTCVAGASRCDDGNPCTADSCDADTGCLNAPIEGVPGILCLFDDHTVEPTAVCPRVPAAVTARFEEARSLLIRASEVATRARRHRLVVAARRKLRRAELLVARAHRRGAIDEGCEASLLAAIRPVREATRRPT